MLIIVQVDIFHVYTALTLDTKLTGERETVIAWRGGQTVAKAY